MGWWSQHVTGRLHRGSLVRVLFRLMMIDLPRYSDVHRIPFASFLRHKRLQVAGRNKLSWATEARVD